jgi:hypothetical protein
VLSRHRDETFEVTTEEAGQRLRFRPRLRGGLRRWQRGKNAHTRYVFEVINQEVLPLDDEVVDFGGDDRSDGIVSEPSSSPINNTKGSSLWPQSRHS